MVNIHVRWASNRTEAFVAAKSALRCFLGNWGSRGYYTIDWGFVKLSLAVFVFRLL